MAYDIKIGEMRTRVKVQRRTVVTDADGYQSESWADVFASPIRCKWVFEYGKEALESRRLQLGQSSTVTCWYSPRISHEDRLVRVDDRPATEWDIVGINVVEDKRKFMVLTVKRRDKA